MRLRIPSVLAVFAISMLVACNMHGNEPACTVSNPCAPVDPNYPEDPDVDGALSQGGRVCRVLRSIHCPEGYRDPRTKRTCYQRLESTAALVDVPFACLEAARSPDDVRACGTKDQLRYRCRTGAAEGDAGH